MDPLGDGLVDGVLPVAWCCIAQGRGRIEIDLLDDECRGQEIYYFTYSFQLLDRKRKARDRPVGQDLGFDKIKRYLL